MFFIKCFDMVKSNFKCCEDEENEDSTNEVLYEIKTYQRSRSATDDEAKEIVVLGKTSEQCQPSVNEEKEYNIEYFYLFCS